MSIYWQPLHNHETFSEISFEELSEAFQKWKTSANHNFIISPVSAQARFKRDRSDTPLRTRSRPRLTCDLILNEVKLTLNDVRIYEFI